MSGTNDDTTILMIRLPKRATMADLQAIAERYGCEFRQLGQGMFDLSHPQAARRVVPFKARMVRNVPGTIDGDGAA